MTYSFQNFRHLSQSQLRDLAEDLRQAILSTCMKNGGHLGASLGTVELAIALHYVFESPREPIIWDVGHQAYAHKLLTGRWERFSTLRTTGGISGFLSRQESEHDVFGAGHSSTSLSAALAMAWSRGRKKTSEDDWTIAVIGDGGLTGGLALEALNNLKDQPIGPLLIVLNDNEMSISPSAGALSAVLKGEGTAAFFDFFGADYVGPFDGHDLDVLIGIFRGIRAQRPERPILLHVRTQKGKGYAPAEERPASFHGVGPLKKEPQGTRSLTFSDAFGASACEAAGRDSRVVAITAAMAEGTGLVKFSEEFPDRFFDVGIAEQHAVTFAAALATQGYRPVVAIYSTFLQRAYDSVIHDVALQNLNVVFAIDRAGVVGPDGPTHHGAFDIAYLGAVPNLRISAPACLGDVSQLLNGALKHEGPWAIRYPRGGSSKELPAADASGLRWINRPEAPKLCVVALGASVHRVMDAVSEIDPKGEEITLVSTLHAKPIPKPLLEYLANTSCPVLTLEDGSRWGGFGQQLLASAAQAAAGPLTRHFEIMGYSDRFIPHGSVADLEAQEGLSSKALAEKIRSLL